MRKQWPAHLRFNWGFHDATFDKESGRNRVLIKKGEPFCLPNDTFYCMGYLAGMSQDISKGRPESSLGAWNELGKGQPC